MGVNASGQLIACRGSIATALGTSTETLSTGVWHYLEIEAAIDDASGIVTVWLHRVKVIDLSGVDTRQQTEAGVDQVPAAATREVRCRVKSGAPSATGAPHPLTATYLYYYRDIFETDPDTTAAWIPAGVNAIPIGPEVVT